MDIQHLQQYLHDHIPLSKAMGVSVVTATTEQVTLAAPLAPNINHRETVFGGSASAVALLAAWSLLHLRLTAEGMPSRVVVQRNTMSYERPIVADFTATSEIESNVWRKFTDTLRRRGRARTNVVVKLHCRGDKVGELEGEFVALTKN